eukprot:CAMPEP_0197038188 /NCGR_PEP_ID=MMETSP1384-20130603/15165_1 /TAXON_ID=29189 /ORGANISM="Ammonia sp." /LENGTH=458 /DNA_ID=CAMNT_0042468585 /DNA_START=50 /DNA_END=1426 /DNA_ORIENTATION=-
MPPPAKNKNKNKNKNKGKKGSGGGGHKKPAAKKQNQNQNKSGQQKQQQQQKAKQKNEGDEMKMDESAFQIRGIELVQLEKYKESGQTFPPSKPVHDLFKEKEYPCGQPMRHPADTDGKYWMESDERKAKEQQLVYQERLRNIREAAEVHRQVRNAAQHFIKPGLTMVEICEFIERSSSQLVGFMKNKPMGRGWGFPTGCSLNHCAAHYTPNTGDKTKLRRADLCKIDFGVQINGNIIDCAFSLAFDAKHDRLMEAVKAATNRGVEVMGIDARLGEVGAQIQEVMESYECEYDNKTYPVKCIRNLNGHSIGPYIIHGGKTVPIIKTDDQTKMEEGELFAIETFGSTGKGIVVDDGECSHFALIAHQNNNQLIHSVNHKGAKELYKYIHKRFDTIPFCRRWLDDDGQKRHLMSLKNLVDSEIVRAYPPLCDKVGCFTAQYEHTILLKPTCKEVVSRGLDF